MGVMDIPLPAAPAGGFMAGALQTNALSKSNLDNTKQQIENQYSPYLLSAEAKLKNAQADFTPFQYLANPMMLLALKDNPQAMQQISNMASNFLNKNPSGSSMPQTLLPQQQNNSLLGMISGLFNKNQQQNPNMPSPQTPFPQSPMPSSPAPQGPINGSDTNNQQALSTSSIPVNNTDNAPYSASVPGTLGGLSGAAGQMTAGLTKRPTGPGEIIPNPKSPGGVISNAESSVAATNQTAMQAISNLKPILQDIIKGAPKWLAPGMEGKLMAAQTINNLEKKLGNIGNIPETLMKKTGLTQKDLSDYAEWQANQEKAVETYMKGRNWPQDIPAMERVSNIIKPHYGEGEAYGNRVNSELMQLENQVLPNYQRTTGGGFEIPASAAQQNQPAQMTQTVPQTPINQALQNQPNTIKEGIANVNMKPGQSLKYIKMPDGKEWWLPENKYEEALKRKNKKAA